MILEFEIPVRPVPKERAAWPTKRTKEFQAIVALYAKQALAKVRDWPKDVSYKLRIAIYEQSAVVRIEALPRVDRAARADCTNILKAIEDGMNKIAWHDDRQVVELDVRDMGKEPA